MVITDLDVGGAERAFVGLATRLDRRFWEPRVVCLGPDGPLSEPLHRASIPTTCLGLTTRDPVMALASLTGALISFRPKLVQSFLFHANVLARLAAPLVGRPWVIGGLRVAERRSNAHLRIDRWTMPLALGSVCVSEGVRSFSVREGRLDPGRLVVIPNGIDVGPIDAANRVDRASLDVPGSATLALYVGRLDAQKGLMTLLDAAERLVATVPDWHLLLVGEGPERPAIEARLAGFQGRVRLLGRRGDVPGLMKAANLLVLPSLWEGMPNVVLEAMAARRAVVATAVEGTEDLVRPGETGWLVPPGDAVALAEALADAASDPERLARYGLAGRERVEREFGIDRVAPAYERLWARVLGLEWPSRRRTFERPGSVPPQPHRS
jgi:glycosyltransferase involved in cell wall biosynthesis